MRRRARRSSTRWPTRRVASTPTRSRTWEPPLSAPSASPTRRRPAAPARSSPPTRTPCSAASVRQIPPPASDRLASSRLLLPVRAAGLPGTAARARRRRSPPIPNRCRLGRNARAGTAAGRVSAAGGRELAGDGGDQSVDRCEVVGDTLDDGLELESLGRDLKLGRELVQMPADPALDAGSLGDEVVAMVDEEPHLARGPVELRGRQVRFEPSRAGDRERVQGIGLAGLAGAAANAGH